jgi:hypothetical protein
MVLIVSLMLLVTPARAGSAKYYLEGHQVGGVWMDDPEDWNLVLEDGQSYAFCCTQDNGGAQGSYTYDISSQEFLFDGALADWGAGQLDADQQLNIKFSFTKDSVANKLIFARVPKFTICPIWPLCT